MLPLTRAVKIAKSKARHKFHRHAAILFNKNQVLGAGWNTGAWHAEENLISDFDCKGSSVLVIRIRRDGRLGMSRPCARCMSMLRFAQAKKVYYSNEAGEIVWERIGT